MNRQLQKRAMGTVGNFLWGLWTSTSDNGATTDFLEAGTSEPKLHEGLSTGQTVGEVWRERPERILPCGGNGRLQRVEPFARVGGKPEMEVEGGQGQIQSLPSLEPSSIFLLTSGKSLCGSQMRREAWGRGEPASGPSPSFSVHFFPSTQLFG